MVSGLGQNYRSLPSQKYYIRRVYRPPTMYTYHVYGVQTFVADEERHMCEGGRPLPSSYYLDESDPDILILRREDGSFVATFSACGATREGIRDAAIEDYRNLLLDPARCDAAVDQRR